MDQNNNNPFFDNPPPQEPKPGPDEPTVVTSGAQVYETVPLYEQPREPAFTPPPPVAPPVATPQGGNNSRRIWIIVLIVVLVLCCCCLVAGLIAWNFGDAVILQMCVQDPTLPICP